MWTAAFVAFFSLLTAEAATAAIVRWMRQGCQWIITPSDLCPDIDHEGLKRFLAHGWDAELGWVRIPNTAHDETGEGGRLTCYHVGSDGARRNPGFENSPPLALAFGDSYTFARQVNDDETWAHHLSVILGGNVANYGVGNYGIDQALLRLEREFDDHPASVVLMGVVPESICRVMSVWKHYIEYGNTLGFKPRFILEGEDLKLLSNPVDTPDKFFGISDLLPQLKKNDVFFERKFSRDLIRFPYVWHLARSWSRNGPLLAAAFWDRMSGGGKRAFMRVMARNITMTAEFYCEPGPMDLLVAICRRFAAFTRAKNATPVILILPQLYDLKQIRGGNHYYMPLMERLADEGIPAVDFAPSLLSVDNDESLYIDDRFGGHFSLFGNRFLAEQIAKRLREIKPDL